MPNWRDGLVEAFPIPEDRRPGYKKKKRLQRLQQQQQQQENEDAAARHIEDSSLEEGLNALNINHSIPTEPFRFFDLPSELRNRIYQFLLFTKPEDHRTSGTRSGSRLGILLGNKRMHSEAAHLLYSTTRFNIFPVQLFEAPPTVLDLPPKYLEHVANLKMTVGPSWTSVPKSWKVTRVLARCLKRLSAVQTLRVFVEFDPSHPAFAKYRISETFYTDFCGDLLGDVLEVMPQIRYIELDGNPSVEVDGPLVSRLREEAVDAEKEVKWGKSAAWAHQRK